MSSVSHKIEARLNGRAPRWIRNKRLGEPRAAMGTAAWYRAIAQVALVAAAIEAVVGIVAHVDAHILISLFVLVAAMMCFAAGTWRARGGRTGPALLMGGTLLVLSIVVALAFEGAPAAALLPMVAFAFSLPSLTGRAIWTFGWLAVLVGGIGALINVEGVLDTEAGFGRISSGVAGVVIEGIIIMVVLIHQRVGLSSLVARYTSIVEQVPMGLFRTTPGGRLLDANQWFVDMLGYPSATELVTTSLSSLVVGPSVADRMLSTDDQGRVHIEEVQLHRHDGTTISASIRIRAVRGEAGQTLWFQGAVRDITEEHEAAALLVERRLIAQASARLGPLETPEATADAITSALVALPGVAGAALISLDGEDTASVMAIDAPPWLPLHTGERLPAGWARYLREHADAGPWSELGSFGPFAEMPDPVGVPASGTRAMAYAPIGEASGLIGILVLATEDPHYARDLMDHIPVLVELANTARLLLADSWLVQRELDETRLRVGSVLAKQRFHPVFQPIVDLTTGAMVGFEALTRFDGWLAPDLAFAQARRVGLGLELEAATLRAALAASVQLPEGAWLSLNVSPTMLLTGDLLHEILAVRARSVVLEVTEHDVVDDYGLLRDAFVALGADLRLAVDDAGAGVANFSHIVELRPDFVKIDIGLIRGINADLSRQALVVGLHHFARASNRDVIAEGIETAAELATLKTLDMRFGQGYLLGRPAVAATWATAATQGSSVAPSPPRRPRPTMAA